MATQSPQPKTVTSGALAWEDVAGEWDEDYTVEAREGLADSEAGRMIDDSELDAELGPLA